MSVEDAVNRWLREVDAYTIVVAVSGGADSSALAAAICDAVRQQGHSPAERVVLAHFDHGIRSEIDSERDLRVVRSLAAVCEGPLFVGRAQGGARRPVEFDRAHRQAMFDETGPAGGPESAARSLRYRFLRDVCRACGARVLVTAHTRDDQEETVLMRLLDGVTGTLLAGIPSSRKLGERVTVHRPLLGVSRKQIIASLDRRGLGWSEDRTNESRAYRRNLVRHEVLPLLEERWPAIRHDLLLLSRAMRRARDLASARAASCAVEYDDSAARIDRRGFFELDADARLELLYRALGRLGMLERRNRPAQRFFAPLLGRDPGGARTMIAARGVRVELVAQALLVERDIVRSGESGYLRIMATDRPVDAGLGWSLTLAREPCTFSRDRVLHLNRIRRPVVVRASRSGDRVTGEGRSVPALLADMGVPHADRGLIPVVVDRYGVTAVLGSVLGYRDVLRPDDRSEEDGLLIVRSALE
ncbi:MAG: tRNA lysidine(34) synthetase TilS [Spirochaetota bacterium]